MITSYAGSFPLKGNDEHWIYQERIQILTVVGEFPTVGQHAQE